MPDTARRYTVEEVLAFPDDGNRYELVYGELLVTPAPAPRHQRVLSRLNALLETYLADHPTLGIVFPAPADISWGQDRLVQPDLFVVPPAEASGDWQTYRTLLLAVEILSPSSGRADRVVKRRLYQEQRVATYWIVDPDAAVVEVWHPDDERPEIVADVLKWRVADEAPELKIDLEKLFKDLAS
jgi:Uma2 family endonuclease